MRFLKLSYLQEQLVLILECLLVVATIARGEGGRGLWGGGGGDSRKFRISVYRGGLNGLC